MEDRSTMDGTFEFVTHFRVVAVKGGWFTPKRVEMEFYGVEGDVNRCTLEVGEDGTFRQPMHMEKC